MTSDYGRPRQAVEPVAGKSLVFQRVYEKATVQVANVVLR
jgi:hypothetical protein